MTTNVEVQLRGNLIEYLSFDKKTKEIERIFNEIEEVANSKLAGNSIKKNLEKSETLQEIYEKALEYQADTYGYFSPYTLPLTELYEKIVYPSDEGIAEALKQVEAGGRLDFSAIAKGYALDQTAEAIWKWTRNKNGDMYLNRKNSPFLINAGGDIIVRESDWLLSDAWKVGLKDPTGDGILMEIWPYGRSICTSGAYERGEHIYNPKTGKPPSGKVLSVTVINESATFADAYSTALFASQDDEEIFNKIIKQVEEAGKVIIIYNDNTFHATQISNGIDDDYYNFIKDGWILR